MNKFVMMYCNICTGHLPTGRVLESFAPARGDMHSPRTSVKYTPCNYTGSTNIPNNIVFMHKPIEFVSTIQLLDINISTDIHDRHIPDTV